MTSKKILIKNLQFFWRVRGSLNEKNIVPDFLPFETDYDVRLSLLRQEKNRENLEALKTVYKEKPNIGNNQEENVWGTSYSTDFLEFIARFINKKKEVKKILEIGCGGCLLLEQLKSKGLSVTGIDPSPFAKEEGKKKNIKVIQDFFPSKKIIGKFDLILHSNVLEHIEQPVEFLREQYKLLSEGGYLMVAVPDCTSQLLNGDISMFLHQHLSYFDNESFRLVLKAAGFKDIQIERAQFGGNLYAYARKKKGISKTNTSRASDGRYEKYEKFIENYTDLKKDLLNFSDTLFKKKNSSLGIYAPVRAFPYIATLNLEDHQLRFFDDATHWHSKYFDGFNIRIENFDDLEKDPVDNILIMSPTFADLIEKKITERFAGQIRTKKITEFYKIKV